MTEKQLNALGKGEVIYDYENDLLSFKVKNRDYLKSIDFDNIVVDIDTEGFITGLRVFDATKIFKMEKLTLKNIKHFEFNAKVEDKIISLQLRFTTELRNKISVMHGQDFIREAINSQIKDSEVQCTVA